MNIAIVGAGIVGVTTAYELARDGHSVTVFEQRSAVAEEASFATGGLLAPGALVPWAAPGGSQALSVWGRQATLRIGRDLSAADLTWLRRWRRASRVYGRSHTPQPPLVALERLAHYSHQHLQNLTQKLDLQFERSAGVLLLLRSPADAVALRPAVQALRDAGTTAQEIDAATARSIEPGLSTETPLVGALHVASGEAGNCRQFALLLRQAAQQLGAQFQFNTTVTRVGHTPASVQLSGEANTQRFDAVVLCAGVASTSLLQPLGIRLPLVALHGCSISAPLREALHAPLSAVIDARHQVSITRLGQRVRVSGGAELGRRHSKTAHPNTLRVLYQVLSDWFPGGTQLSGSVQEWRNARPSLPDGPPVLGASGLPGLWLNVGHGASGWALACGSARALADTIAGRSADISLEGLDAQRF